MNSFRAESLFFSQHASDADARRNDSDTSFYAEWPRHFIDIDGYPDFQHLSHNLDSVILLYGWETVKQRGINPWATQWVLDTLTSQLARNDPAMYYTASDLGHYIADAHQPLHCTANYNPGGLHSRYETTMINMYQAELAVHPDSIAYVASPVDYAFTYIYHSNSLVSSLIFDDTGAKAVANWDGVGSAPNDYYAQLWLAAKDMTLDQFQRATVAIGSLWYTAWVNAGNVASVDNFKANFPAIFSLHGNYPNPFNPTTTVSYTLASPTDVVLTVFSVDGKQMQKLIGGRQEPGDHFLHINLSDSPSGVYFYRMQAGQISQTRKMELIK